MLVNRLDTSGIIQSFRETAEGFLDLHLTFSKCGALTYQRSDGTFEDEYLTAEDLFNEDSLATATGKPVCYLHPSERITKNNVRQFIRGATGTKIIKDGIFATILATVHDAELIDVIKSGKAKEVSAAYTAQTVRGDDGRIYQKSRTYEHFAVVPSGRAGPDVRVHYDSKTNQFENMGIQVMTHTDEMISLIAVEVGARNSYIQRLKTPLKNDSGAELKRAIAASVENNARQKRAIEPEDSDGRKAYIARLKAGGKR